jgi:hypothetical protein
MSATRHGLWLTPRTAHIFCELNSQLGEFARALLHDIPRITIVKGRMQMVEAQRANG